MSAPTALDPTLPPPSESEQEEFERRLSSARAEEARAPLAEVEGRPVAWAPQDGSQTEFMACPLQEVLYHGTRGPGKCLALDELVLTTQGWVRAGDITMSHTLIAGDGTPTRLVGIYPNPAVEMRRITLHDGTTLTACKDHRWLSCSASNSIWRVRTTEQMRLSPDGYVLPYMEGAIPGPQWSGLDPYMCGLLLGDGSLSERCAHVVLYSQDAEILSYAQREHGWGLGQYDGCVARVTCPAAQDELWRSLLGAHTGRAKRVPEALLWADPASRLALLQGLMDSDGSIDEQGRCGFTSVSQHLADAVLHLVFSLGGRGTKTYDDRPPTGISAGELGGRWRVRVSSLNKFSLFRLSRKRARERRKTKKLTRGIRSIEPCGIADGVCFAVDHLSHTFITTNWVVTHNTDALLMDFAQHVGKGHGAAWAGILFRQTYPQLADVQAKSEKWFRAMWPGARFNQAKMEWRWPTGERLLLRHMGKLSDYNNYHGHEYPWIGWEELSNWADDACFKAMFSCNRCSTPGVPRKIRATTNPYGPGHNWIKDRYRLAGQWWKIITILDPLDISGQPEPPRAAIHGHIDENLILLRADPDYKRTIVASASNPEMVKAWLSGSWDIAAGGMFGDVWSNAWNVVPAFAIPETWRIDRAFDWGSARPFSVGWWAESDGCDITLPDGTTRSTVRGDLFRVAEWYGFTGKPNEGLNMLARDIARGIVERELQWGWRTGTRDSRVRAGPADTSIFDVENGNSIAEDMARRVRLSDGRLYKGVLWTRADKSRGSRKTGWQQMRNAMGNARPAVTAEGRVLPREEPGLFVFDTCRQFIRTVPALPRDEKDMDDVDTDAEDHIGDEARYRVRQMRLRTRAGRTIGMH